MRIGMVGTLTILQQQVVLEFIIQQEILKKYLPSMVQLQVQLMVVKFQERIGD